MKDTSLALTGLTSVDLGEKLLLAAQEKNRQQIIQSAVSFVSDLMNSVSESEKKIEEYKMYLKTYKARLSAIEKGEFVVSKYNNQIVYNDSKLNGWLK